MGLINFYKNISSDKREVIKYIFILILIIPLLYILVRLLFGSFDYLPNLIREFLNDILDPMMIFFLFPIITLFFSIKHLNKYPRKYLQGFIILSALPLVFICFSFWLMFVIGGEGGALGGLFIALNSFFGLVLGIVIYSIVYFVKNHAINCMAR